MCSPHRSLASDLRPRLPMAILVCCLLTLACPAAARVSAADTDQTVLVVQSYHHGFTWTDKISDGLRTHFKQADPQVELIFEFLDARRVFSEDYFRELVDVFDAKYARRDIDVVVCADDHALNFVLDRLGHLFADTPTVFCSVSGFAPAMRVGRELTGLQESIDIEATLDLALALHPATRQVVVITDLTKTGQALKVKAEDVFRAYPADLTFRHLENLTIEELSRSVAALPADAIVMLFIFSRDREGRVLSHEENLAILSRHCRVPIYAVWEFYLGHGIVGGKLTSGRAEGQLAAALTLRILAGERASQIPLQQSPTKYMFDHHLLERHRIRPARLPAGSIVINRPFSFYETYLNLVWGVLAFIIVLVAVIALLISNIAGRRRAEDSLKMSEEKFATAFASSPDIIVITRRADDRIIDANEQFLRYAGLTREASIGSKITALGNWVDRDQRKRFAAILQTEGQVDNFETVFRRSNGRKTPFLVSARLIAIGREQCIVLAARDIGDMRRAEEALRQYEKIVSATRDMMAFVDDRYVYQAVNEAYLDAFRRPRADIVGRSIPGLLGPEIFQEELKAHFDQALAGETVTFDAWYDYEGWGRRYMRVTYYPYLDAREGHHGVVINARDITRTRQLESQLIQSQKMEAVGTLAGGLAHDFNNLLMGIQGRASLIMTDLAPGDPVGEHIQGIQDCVASATNLTKQLLGFARGGKYEIKATDINRLAARSLEMFGRTHKEIKIHSRMEAGIWTVEVDRHQMEQVFLNLFVNAWQAMPGGGNLFLQTENTVLDEGTVEAHKVRPGRYVKVAVTDSGIGMDAATCQKVFDPFFTTKSIGRGSGLGLASAYGIIKNHGGFVTVYSEKGTGTTFNLYLPASDKAYRQETVAEETIRAGHETILLVDDEAMILEVGAAMFRKLGYEVMTAEGGAEAIACFTANSDTIDLVVLDMIMPEIGGGEVYDRLKAIRPDVKVLLSSGYSINGDATAIMAKGCNGFIQKPFSVSQISNKIREILDP